MRMCFLFLSFSLQLLLVSTQQPVAPSSSSGCAALGGDCDANTPCCDSTNYCDTHECGMTYKCVSCKAEGQACCVGGCCSGLVCDTSDISATFKKCIPSSPPVSAPKTNPVASPVSPPKTTPVAKPFSLSCASFGNSCKTSECCGDLFCRVDDICCVGLNRNCTKDDQCCMKYCSTFSNTCGSCMSGKTGVFLADSARGKKSTKKTRILKKTKKSKGNKGAMSTVITVKDLKIGDTILGMDEQQQPSDKCKVVFKGLVSKDTLLYGNYTSNHYVLDPINKASIVSYSGTANVPSAAIYDEGYDLLTSCPLGKDESGIYFSPTVDLLCSASTLSWKDYFYLWKSLYQLSTIIGIYDFSAFVSIDLAAQYSKGICTNGLKCVYDKNNCNDVEKWSVDFVNNVLTEEYQKKIQKIIKRSKGAFPSLGQGFISSVLPSA